MCWPHNLKPTYLQGAAGKFIVLQPTKTAMTFCDIDLGRWIDVPAFSFQAIFFSDMARGQAQNPYIAVFTSALLAQSDHYGVRFWLDYANSTGYGDGSSDSTFGLIPLLFLLEFVDALFMLVSDLSIASIWTWFWSWSWRLDSHLDALILLLGGLLRLEDHVFLYVKKSQSPTDHFSGLVLV